MSQEPFNFEESMETLEKIVKSLESENNSLEKNIELFEEGLVLSKNLQKHLEFSRKENRNIVKRSKWRP
tara:strand:+ start:461 stop:667 length:207 start_codon:yes stop_codon:yes gene_type:complete